MKRATGTISRLTIALGCLVSLLLVATGFAGAAAPVTMHVTPGLNGWIRSGDWLPLDVELANEGPDLEARVVVDVGTGQVSNGQRADPYRTEYVADASLPQHSHKLIRISVPFDGRSQDLSVKLVQGKDTLVQQKVTPAHLETNQLLVAILSSQPQQAARGLGSLGNGSQRTIVPVWLDVRSFPDHPEMLGSADVVILDSFPTGDLSSAQRQALNDWVSEGGTLVAVGGADWRRTLSPLPDGLLPVAVSDDGVVDAFSALARFASISAAPTGQIDVSQAKVRDGQVVAAAGTTPLVVVARRGLGRVAYVAADPMADPLGSWRDVSQLWHAIIVEATPSGLVLSPNRGLPANSSSTFLSQLNNALSNFPSLEPPSIDTLALLLLGYIVLIGIVSYVVLGRLRRRELGWITVPAIALVFTVGTYAVARNSRGTNILVSTVSVLRLDPGRPGVAVSAIGAFTPGDADYRLTLDSPSLPLDLPTQNSGAFSPGAPGSTDPILGMKIQEGDRQQILDLSSSAPWALRGVWMRQPIEKVGQIDAVLHPEGQHLRGTVTNHTRLTLNDCLVIVGDSFVRIGTLPVGGTAPVDLSVQPSNVANLKRPNGLFEAYMPRPTSVSTTTGSSVGYASIHDQLEAQMRKQPVLSAWIEADPRLGGRGAAPVTFVGWSDQRLVSATQNGHPVSGPSLDLVSQALEIDFSGAFDTGPGLITGRVIDGSAAPPFPNGGTGFRLNHGAATVEFFAPAPDRLRSLGFQVATSNVVAVGRAPLAAEIYDWSSDTWLKIDPGSIKPASTVVSQPPQRVGQIVVAQAGSAAVGGYAFTLDEGQTSHYISATGAVRLRLSADTNVVVNEVSLIARGRL